MPTDCLQKHYVASLEDNNNNSSNARKKNPDVIAKQKIIR